MSKDELAGVGNGSTTLEIERRKSFLLRSWELYRDGFRNMGRWSKQLWLLVIIKLLIMFGILRVFLFPNYLSQQADTEEGKSQFVGTELIERGVMPE